MNNFYAKIFLSVLKTSKDWKKPEMEETSNYHFSSV